METDMKHCCGCTRNLEIEKSLHLAERERRQDKARIKALEAEIEAQKLKEVAIRKGNLRFAKRAIQVSRENRDWRALFQLIHLTIETYSDVGEYGTDHECDCDDVLSGKYH
jgi:hypothetical protein